MSIQQQKNVKEILSFVQNQRKKQDEDLLDLFIDMCRKESQKIESFVK